MVAVAALAANVVLVSSGRGDDSDLAANQVGRQLRQPIVSDLRPSDIRSRHSRPRCSRFPWRPWRNASQTVRDACQAMCRSRNPITGIAGCCARAASGHAAAAPPSSVMNSRRSHSITSSARASSDGGISRPSALAVLRLITSSNLVGCLHRKVGRLLALEDAIDVAGRPAGTRRLYRPRRTSGRHRSRRFAMGRPQVVGFGPPA